MSSGWCKWGLAVVVLGCSARLLLAQGSAPAPQGQDSSQSQPVAQGDQSGQSAQNDTVPVQDQAEDSATYDARRDSRAPVPLPLNIDATSLQFAEGEEHQNYLFGGVGASATYDDNLLSQSAVRTGGFAYSLFPTVGVNVSRRRLILNTDYEGGYTFNQRFSAFNQSEHNADFDLRYRVSPHVNLRIHNHFLLTTGFLDQLSGGLSGIGTGIIQQPNLGVITPIAPHTFDLGSVELTYQYSASDMIGGSGNVYISSFGTPPAGAQNLVDSRSEGGNAFYTHRFTPRNWSGIAYSFQRLTFDPIMEDVNTHDILLFHTIYLNQHTALAFFAGPEYTQLDSVIVTTHVAIPFVTVTSTTDTQDRWGVAGGASFSWQGRHTSLSAGGSRKVSDGGGLLTASAVTSGTGAVRHQLNRSSTIELDVVYTGSHALGNGGTTFFSDSKAAWGNFLWEQRVGKNLLCTLGYARDYLQQSGTSLPTLGVNHNRGWVSVVYRFSRPLGR